MSAHRLLTPARRDALLAVVAIALVAGPLWAPALHFGDPTYRYERVEVTTDGAGIEYVNESSVPLRTAISEDIGCSGGWDVRTCAFERLLVDNRTVPSGVYSSNPNRDPDGFEERYRYVLLNDTVYETVYHTNGSVQRDDGMYRVDLAIEPASPGRALQRVSLAATSDDVPSVVADAARNGEARARQQVRVPETVIRLEDGTYYRVYLAERSDAPPMSHVVDSLLTYVAPLVGLYLLVGLSRRVSMTHLGDDARRGREKV